MSDEEITEPPARGAPGAAKAQVEALQRVLARAKTERSDRDRRRAELYERLEAKLDGERQTREGIEAERAEAQARIVHLEHSLAQAVRRLALIDEKLAAAAAYVESSHDGDGTAPVVQTSTPRA